MMKLYVVIVSTRQERMGPSVGHWFDDFAFREGSFEVELVDLAEVNLPMVDEPAHPRLQLYEHAHTKAWSTRVSAADAFVFVTPEYNYSAPPSLINALDYLVHEWAYKPCAFVSYGGVSGGTRSVLMTKQVVTTLKMMPMMEAVTIPFFAQYINEQGTFVPTELHEQSADVMLKELHRWTKALKPLRAE